VIASRVDVAGAQWNEVGARETPSWYLDPLVAAQKRELHQALIRQWLAGRQLRRIWKTDLFEEANGPDSILFDLLPPSVEALGTDVAMTTVERARGNSSNPRTLFCVCDARAAAIRSESLDAVISTSTLDHFETRQELEAALAELARVLRPEGVLIVTLDNPQNPLYGMLRWYSRTRAAPFRLGRTLSQKELRASLERAGLTVTNEDVLIHNPRLISTALFLVVRTALGPRADRLVGGLLKLFAWLGSLPTRRYTACFIAACGTKRG
jgi:SAM-dependent methyltransferase